MSQSRFVTRATGSMISGLSGDGGLGVAAVTTVTTTAVSSTTLVSVRWTSSDGVPGSMRQLTVALADCGNAFSACPPASSVATQVVRSWALYSGLASESRRIAAVSGGVWARAAMSVASWPCCSCPHRANDARVISFSCAENWYALRRPSAAASR